MGEYEAMKRRAGAAAADEVEPGMVVGLGTGSTAAFAIAALGEAVDAGLDITGVPTSVVARERARRAGIPIADLADVERIDIAIDGADQAADGTLIKGGGGAHTRERLVDATADRFLVVVDERKPVDQLDAAVPLEVLPPAERTVSAAVADRAGEATRRESTVTDGPAYTEWGNLLLDVEFGRIDDPADLAHELKAIPGVVDHGLFVGLADALIVGTPTGVSWRW